MKVSQCPVFPILYAVVFVDYHRLVVQVRCHGCSQAPEPTIVLCHDAIWARDDKRRQTYRSLRNRSRFRLFASVKSSRSCGILKAECTGDSWTIETIISRDSWDNASRTSQKFFRHCYKGSILREVGTYRNCSDRDKLWLLRGSLKF
jgi:hypothetical protein